MTVEATVNNPREAFENYALSHRHDLPLYSLFASAIASRPQLADVFYSVRAGRQLPFDQRRPSNLFAAVHAVLLEEHGMGFTAAPLAAYFGSINGDNAQRLHSPADERNAAEAFESFLRTRKSRIEDKLHERGVIANEPGRAAVLFPGLSLVSQVTQANALSVVEVGSSAGLTTTPNDYQITFGAAEVGTGRAGVNLQPELVGALRPIVNRSLGNVFAVGLDRERVDPDEDGPWLTACIPGEDPQRHRSLNRAIAHRKAAPLNEVITGDAVLDFAKAIDLTPGDRPLVVMNSFLLMYLDAANRHAFAANVATAAADRDVWWLSFEYPRDQPIPSQVQQAIACTVTGGADTGVLLLGHIGPHGKTDWRHLANASLYGEQLHWLDEGTGCPKELALEQSREFALDRNIDFGGFGSLAA